MLGQHKVFFEIQEMLKSLLPYLFLTTENSLRLTPA